MPFVAKEKQEATDVSFFGSVDLNQHGNPSGQFPSWMFPNLMRDMQDEIDENERALTEGGIDGPAAVKLKANQKALKQRLDAIKESYPKKTVDKDKVKGFCGIGREGGELGEKIAETMFSRSDMKKGVADAHEECTRMMDPCIKLSPEEAGFAQMCRVSMTKDRMVSRKSAEKMWKMGRAFLGEPSNTEILRRD